MINYFSYFEVNDFYEEINKAIMNPIEEKKLFKHANNFKIDKKLKSNKLEAKRE